MSPIQVFYSNKVEILYNQLKQRLFGGAVDPFCRRIIVVPSPAIKSWVMLQLAKDPEIGIGTGVEVVYIDQTLAKMTRNEGFLNNLELALALETEIKSLISTEWTSTTWQPLFKYLKIKDKLITRQSERRLASLCQTLASLFKEYGIYGENFLNEWELLPSVTNNWQMELWKRLFENRFDYPCRQFKNTAIVSNFAARPTQLHLFSLSYIPKIYHQFLERASVLLPVHYYLLSPCLVFWSDIRSDKESRRLQSYWKKRGISKSSQETLEQFLRDRNPLLANFGRLGREMAQQIEESQAQTDAIYALPECIQESVYEEYLTEDVALYPVSELSMLDVLLADMALLRYPETAIEITASDRSVQIHAASSKMREVQIVYDLIIGLIDKHSDDEAPICPEDIIIMAPDIMEYEALIKSVFGSSESLLDFHVLDLNMPSQNQTIQAFLHLIGLSSSRWDSVSLLQLFDYPDFQKILNWKSEDLIQIRQWIVDLNIYWGVDRDHRTEMFTLDYGVGKKSEPEQTGTWEYGFSRMISGAILDARSHEIPYDNIAGTKLELVGQLVKLIRSLKSDLKIFGDGTKLTLGEWTKYLEALAESYLGLDDQIEDHLPFFEQLRIFKKACKLFPEDKFRFSTIKIHLENAFNQEKISFRETRLHAVRFCSMLPMRAIPAKIILLMGMNEGVFPKQEKHLSLNLLRNAGTPDYVPTTTDYDRYLFLEALLSSRRYFICTYQGYSPETGKESPPSLLVTEILSYLDQACSLDGKKPSALCVKIHPYHAYDRTYFETDSFFNSYSQKQFLAAKVYYQIDKKPDHLFVSDFEVRSSPLALHDISIPLDQLKKLAKNPLKAFLNSLGLYIKEEDPLKTEEEIALTKLDLYQYKKESVYESLQDIIKKAAAKGELPVGLFKDVAVIDIQKSAEEFRENYNKLEIKPEEIFSIEFNENQEVVEIEEGKRRLPALKIPYKNNIIVTITGKFDEVHRKGLISYAKNDLKDLAKIWPEYLVFHLLVSQYALDIDRNVLLTKDGVSKECFFEEALPLLKDYIDYYLRALLNASPFDPEWISDLLKDDEIDLGKLAHKTVSSQYNYNNYLRWIHCQNRSVESSKMSNSWKPQLQTIFGRLHKHWLAK